MCAAALITLGEGGGMTILPDGTKLLEFDVNRELKFDLNRTLGFSPSRRLLFNVNRELNFDSRRDLGFGKRGVIFRGFICPRCGAMVAKGAKRCDECRVLFSWGKADGRRGATGVKTEDRTWMETDVTGDYKPDERDFVSELEDTGKAAGQGTGRRIPQKKVRRPRKQAPPAHAQHAYQHEQQGYQRQQQQHPHYQQQYQQQQVQYQQQQYQQQHTQYQRQQYQQYQKQQPPAQQQYPHQQQAAPQVPPPPPPPKEEDVYYYQNVDRIQLPKKQPQRNTITWEEFLDKNKKRSG